MVKVLPQVSLFIYLSLESIIWIHNWVVGGFCSSVSRWTKENSCPHATSRQSLFVYPVHGFFRFELDKGKKMMRPAMFLQFIQLTISLKSVLKVDLTFWSHLYCSPPTSKFYSTYLIINLQCHFVPFCMMLQAFVLAVFWKFIGPP